MRDVRVAARLFVCALGVASLLPSTGHAQAKGNPEAGKAVFRAQCGICHADQPSANRIGPTLFGLVGRKTGAVTGYAYSVGNQNANLTWDPATLDTYLQSPRTVVPGTKMTFGGLKDDTKRADIIAYLVTLK